MSKEESGKGVLVAGPLPPPWGGAAVSFSVFVQYLNEREYSCSIFDLRWRSSSQEPLLSLWGFLRNIWLFLRLFYTSLSYSHVVLFGSQRFIAWFCAPLIVLLRLFRKSTSLRIFGGGFHDYIYSFPSPLRNLLCWSLSCATTIVLQTDEVKIELEGTLETELIVVPNYRNDSFSTESSADDDVPFRFVYAGFVRQEKGVRDLLQAFEEVAESGRKVELYIAGPLFMDLEANETIHVLGEVPREKITELFQSSHCLVYPTHWPREGIPGVLIEAGLARLPIITTRWKAIPSLIEDGKTGLLVEPGHVKQLAETMKRMVDDSELRERLREDNREKMVSFESSSVCPRLLTALRIDSQ